MSRERYQARSKKVQRLGRDGLVELDRATGEEIRVSQRTEDISFGPERPARQDAGQDGARSRQRKQIREQAAQSGFENGLEHSGALDVPTPEHLVTPYTADVPMNAAAPSERRERYKRAAVRRQHDPPQQLFHEQDRSGDPQFELKQDVTATAATPEETESAAPREMEAIMPRDTGTRPAPRYLPGKTYKRTEKRRREDDGRLQFNHERPPDNRTAAKHRQAAKRAPNAVAPEQTRLQFEDAPKRADSPAVAPDTRRQKRYAAKERPDVPAPDNRTAEKPRQAAKRTPDVAESEHTRLQFEDAPKRAASPAVAPAMRQQKRYAAAERPDAPAPDNRTAEKPQQTTERTPDATKPERTQLQFEDAPRKADPPAAPSKRQQKRYVATDRQDTPVPDNRAVENPRQTAEHTPDAAKPERKRLQFEDVPTKKANPPAGSPAAPTTSQNKRPAAQNGQGPKPTQNALPAERRAQPERPSAGNPETPRRRLRFENEKTPAVKRVGGALARTTTTAAAATAHNKLQEAEGNNVAVEAAHRGEFMAERGTGRFLRWNRSRRQAAGSARNTQTIRQAAQGNPKFSSNPYSRWQQKRAIKQEYAAAKRAGTTTNRTVAKTAAKAKEKSADFVKKHKKGFLILGGFALIFVIFSSLITACSTMFQGGASAAVATTTYPSEDIDMLAAEAWYTSKENALQLYLNTYRATHDYNEYNFTLDEIGHDPYVLISALTALRGGAWKFDEVQDTLQMLFDRQYILTETVTTETRKRMVNGAEVEYSYSICTVTLVNFDLSHVPVYIMGESQLSMYAMYMGALGNRTDLFPTSGYINRYVVVGYTEHEIPASALEDETFAAMISEAEKYLGYPYVWGGYNPNTSFDCSGFVSWVVNQSGWNIGRLDAQSLYNICTPTSTPKPGDLVFFTGTYDAGVPVTHVGLYVGDGWMIHAGDPISYCNVGDSYYQSHLYAYGVLP